MYTNILSYIKITTNVSHTSIHIHILIYTGIYVYTHIGYKYNATTHAYNDRDEPLPLVVKRPLASASYWENTFGNHMQRSANESYHI